jgi:hypothetical protein
MSDPEPYTWRILDYRLCRLCRGEEYVEADDYMRVCPRCAGNGIDPTYDDTGV